MARYDEDLHENLFFNTLVSKYNILFTEAAERKWMVSFIALLPGITTPGLGVTKKGGGAIELVACRVSETQSNLITTKS